MKVQDWTLVEDIKTNATELINIWMVDLGQEADFWWCHGVIIWEEEF